MDQDDVQQMYLNNTWRANVSITGADGLPPTAKGGNVIRQGTGVRVSMRLPPNAKSAEVHEAMRKKLTENVPYNCKVTTEDYHYQGWHMKEMQPWFRDAFQMAG